MAKQSAKRRRGRTRVTLVPMAGDPLQATALLGLVDQLAKAQKRPKTRKSAKPKARKPKPRV